MSVKCIALNFPVVLVGKSIHFLVVNLAAHRFGQTNSQLFRWHVPCTKSFCNNNNSCSICSLICGQFHYQVMVPILLSFGLSFDDFSVEMP
jgi:hypothetical protein